jgi:hypothetical protein
MSATIPTATIDERLGELDRIRGEIARLERDLAAQRSYLPNSAFELGEYDRLAYVALHSDGDPADHARFQRAREYHQGRAYRVALIEGSLRHLHRQVRRIMGCPCVGPCGCQGE